MAGGLLDRVCRALYALALILAVAVTLLAPLHARYTRSLWVASATSDGRVVLTGDGVAPGTTVPLYRFHAGWTRSVGEVTVLGTGSDGLVAEVGEMRFPVGRHARVVADEGDRVRLAFDAEVSPGTRLHVFDGERRMAHLLVTGRDGDTTLADCARKGPPRDLVGLVATEFSVPTRAVVFDAPLVAALEVAVLVGAVLLWALSLVHRAPARAWSTLAGSLRDALGRLAARPHARIAFHAVLGVPVAFYGGQFAWFTLTWIPHRVGQWLRNLDVVPSNPLPPFPEAGAPFAIALGGLAYAAWLATRGTSPLLALWDALAWRPILPGLPPAARGFALWALHLVIAWFFASTLFGFLQGNAREATNLLAGPLTADTALEVARYALWSLTILGCLFGYGHTVVAMLWTRPIRELDFTVAGWATTAVCYGPLLGAVLSRVVGSETDGARPVVTMGPLHVAVPIVELLLNALYTASIWNLGRYFGVMTDKGVRTTGFYATVRHPSYTLEALMFVAIGLPHAGSATQWAVALAYLLKYALRSEREDHFMGAADPAYAPYRERVPWKFVPGLY